MSPAIANLWATVRRNARPFARQWRKELAIAVALLIVLIGPFLLRPADSSAPSRYDRRLVIMTPHTEQIRQELALAFVRKWKQEKGETLAIDWRVAGTSDLKKLIESDYRAAFQRHWTSGLGQRWSDDVGKSFLNLKAPKVPDAREAFLESNVSIGVDLFFGGGPHDFNDQAAKGILVASDKATQAGIPAIVKAHPDWFEDKSFPLAVSGQTFRDKDYRWVGTCMSSFGIVYNRDVLRRLGVAKDPEQWSDLADPKLMGQIALGDPNGSSSVVTAFEILIQQQIHLALDRLTKNPGRFRSPAQTEALAVRQGWLEGLRLIQRIAGNTRYFADTSAKIPLEVTQGDAAAGMCIDFYGRSSEEAVRKADGTTRVGFIAPLGGTSFAVDPIALMRGAPQPKLAQAFMEFIVSEQGQKLWDFRPGTPGGPQHTALRRLPIRKDFYTKEHLAFMSDPAEEPYEKAKALVYHPEWTSPVFNSLRFIIRVLCVDTHDELRRTWKMLSAQGRPPRATEVFEQLTLVDYDAAMGDINKVINSSDKVQQVREARRLTDAFRRQYEQAYDFAKVQR
ncbi:MAG: iron transporter substrate-binding protein [Verrucomicrobiaceae bacterium]|nr:iron transporter substrate-binding protein [Verrucomicrobiaceae bacterium]